MIFRGVDPFEWTAADGITYRLKVMRDMVAFTNYVEVDLLPGETVSGLAVRTYGDNREDDAWKILEANIIQIIENQYSLEGIRTLKVPV